MNNRKGFTLVEVIVMIVMILVVALMFSNNMEGILGTQNDVAYERFINKINVASNSFVSSNPEYINEIQYGKGFTTVTIRMLIENGYIDKDLVDPRIDAPINRDELALIKLNCLNELNYTYPYTLAIDKITYVQSTSLVINGIPGNNYLNINTIGLRMIDDSGSIVNLNPTVTLTNPGDIKFISASYVDASPGTYQIVYNYLDDASICRIHIREVIIY